jgi:hypothetical protein
VLSYLGIRKVVGWVALGLPFALMIVWSFSGERLLSLSISGYYYTTARNLFGGSLCAIAVLQFCCRGYDRKDEIACILFGLAPSAWPSLPLGRSEKRATQGEIGAAREVPSGSLVRN